MHIHLTGLLDFSSGVWILIFMHTLTTHKASRVAWRITSHTLAVLIGLSAVSVGASSWSDQDMKNLLQEMSQHRKVAEAGAVWSKWTDKGTYVRAADGDTLAVRTNQHGLITVRVAGVDAPERGQDLALEAAQFLQAFARGAELTLTCSTIDKYGRHVCQVHKGQSDLGAGLIEKGLALHFKRYAHEQPAPQRELYSKLEAQAKANRLGVWSKTTDFMTPDECRKAKSQGMACL
jgi:endonuclease YncB( thermonuclease family)